MSLWGTRASANSHKNRSVREDSLLTTSFESVMRSGLSVVIISLSEVPLSLTGWLKIQRHFWKLLLLPLVWGSFQNCWVVTTSTGWAGAQHLWSQDQSLNANWSFKNYNFCLGWIKNICLVCFRRAFCKKKNESVRSYLIQEWVVQSNAKKAGGDNTALASRLSRYPNMVFKFNFLVFL